MIKIPEIKKQHAPWTPESQWESGARASMIQATTFPIVETLYDYVVCGLNRNLEFQVETYWLGDGRFEGCAVIEPEEKEKRLTEEEARMQMHPINFSKHFTPERNLEDVWKEMREQSQP